MKVKDVMTSGPLACAPGTSLAVAAQLMLDGDCGVLPVIVEGRVVGVVTDRDLFIALGTRNRPASELTVGEVVSPRLWTCDPDDKVSAVLRLMKEHQIRRVPVVGPDNQLLGIVSMNDIILLAGPRQLVRDEVVEALQSIGAHHQPLVRVGGGPD